MIVKLNEINNIGNEEVELTISLEKDVYYSTEILKIKENIRTVNIYGNNKKFSFLGFCFNGNNDVKLNLYSVSLIGITGALTIFKKNGALCISANGDCLIEGGSASFGPTSLNGNSAIHCDILEINCKEGSKLKVIGGRTFSSIMSSFNLNFSKNIVNNYDAVKCNDKRIFSGIYIENEKVLHE